MNLELVAGLLANQVSYKKLLHEKHEAESKKSSSAWSQWSQLLSTLDDVLNTKNKEQTENFDICISQIKFLFQIFHTLKFLL